MQQRALSDSRRLKIARHKTSASVRYLTFLGVEVCSYYYVLESSVARAVQRVKLFSRIGYSAWFIAEMAFLKAVRKSDLVVLC